MKANEDIDKIIDDVFIASKTRQELYEQYLKPYYHRKVYYSDGGTAFSKLLKDFWDYECYSNDFLWEFERDNLIYQDTRIRGDKIIICCEDLCGCSTDVIFEIPLDSIYKTREQLIKEYNLTNIDDSFNKWKEDAESKKEEIELKYKQIQQIRREISELMNSTTLKIIS